MPTPTLPQSSRDRILDAFSLFDREYRDTAEWADWTRLRNHRYAISHDGRLYPVKKIVSLATGIPTQAFSGGAPANSFIEQYGFKIVHPRANAVVPPLKWWVNQGRSYADESAGSYIWAPKTKKDGSRKPSYEAVADVRPGDGIVHYANGSIRAIGTVLSEAREEPRSADRPDQGNTADGWYVEVRYQPLRQPIALDAIPIDLRRGAGGPFRSDGAVDLGYLYPLPANVVSFITDVVDRVSTVPAPAHRTWIFQANPAKFDVARAVRELSEIDWTLRQCKNDIEAGDRVYIWQSGEDAGIVASATVEGDAFQAAPSPASAPYWLDAGDLETADQTRIRIRIDEVLEPLIPRSTIKAYPGLGGLSIIKQPRGTNYPVTAAEAEALAALLESRGPNGLPRNRRSWVIAAGENARLWPGLYAAGIIAIGWDELGDLRQYPSQAAITAALAKNRDESEPINDSLACWQFANEVAPGDWVFAKRGRSEILGWGIVVGDYTYDESRAEYRSVRQVDWRCRGSWHLPKEAQVPTKTLTEVTNFTNLLGHIVPLVDVAAGGQPAPMLPTFSVDDALRDAFMSREGLNEILEALVRKKNVVLVGPPGVGKTFLARRIAYARLGYEDPSRVQLVQFHQSYAYEDFVQGWRPSEDGAFVLAEGPFFKFCERAERDPNQSYVFIIDEINRGNLSKIFGELLMLIEGDKRSPEYAMRLTYASSAAKPFYVPPNVHLIGLMNSADRSLAMVDYALRRRFAFAKLRPGFDQPAFRTYLLERGAADDLVGRIVTRMEALNDRIRQDVKNLGAGYQIGHSFFCSVKRGDVLDDGWYHAVIRNEIAPLLEEYWFDSPRIAREEIQKLLA